MTRLKDVLEIISYVSQGGLLIVGILALGQIKIAKKDIAIRSRRESIVLAADQIERFREDFLPKITELNKMYRSINAMEAPKYRFEDFTEKELRQASSKIANIMEKYRRVLDDEKFNVSVQELMNLFEGFSVYFTEGVADEKVAFKPLGQVFCDFVEENSFMYCIYRNQEEMNYYDNTIKLYKTWSGRIIQRKLQDDKSEINKKLKKINIPNIKTIGFNEKV